MIPFSVYKEETKLVCVDAIALSILLFLTYCQFDFGWKLALVKPEGNLWRLTIHIKDYPLPPSSLPNTKAWLGPWCERSRERIFPLPLK